MKIYISANNFTQTQNAQIDKCIETLTRLGHECSIDEDRHISTISVEDCDLIVSLGGDGALLKAGHIALKNNKPLIGINSGRLGFLCVMKIEDIEQFNNVFEQCKLSKRTVIEFEHDKKIYKAINDIVVSKTNIGSTVDLSVNVDEQKEILVRSDGLIVSTPTGSSAYNVAAGGPYIDYKAKVLALTPICAHQSYSHSMVVDDDREINIKVNHEDAGIYVDGELVVTIDNQITIRKSDDVLNLYYK